MTATTADYVSEEPKGMLSGLADTIRLAMKLKDEFEKLTTHKCAMRLFVKSSHLTKH